MKHNEFIHKDDRFPIIGFISFISRRKIKEQLLNTVLYKDQLPDLFSAKSQQTFTTNIYTTKNKSEPESFSQNKTIFFQELLVNFFFLIVELQYLDLGVSSLKISHRSNSCTRAKIQGC